VRFARFTFPSTADAEEVLRTFAESGEFDIFSGDQRYQTIRRRA
jgi:hypothetical protein